MNTFSKVGIVIAILAVPALIGLFGYMNLHQHASLPVYFATDSVPEGNGYKVIAAKKIPDFRFTDQNGKSFSSNVQLKGKYYIADFIFTNCPGICKDMTGNLQRVQEVFAEDRDFRIVSFTVDPARDTVESLKDYSQRYNADPSRWYFLTGEKDSIYALGQKHFLLSVMENPEVPLDFLHSEKLVLVDKNGWVRGYYDGTDQKDVEKLIEEVRTLKYIYDNESAHSQE